MPSKTSSQNSATAQLKPNGSRKRFGSRPNTSQHNTLRVFISDLLVIDKEGNFAVIELKAGLATDRIVGQVLGYMRYIRKNLAKVKI